MFVSVPAAARILHADADAFYASVAQRDDASLRGRPTVVGSWVVMAASYEARAFGVRSGMPTARARRLCPGLAVASPSWETLSQAGAELIALFRAAAPVVQPGSLEEAFLDLRGCDADPVEVARRLRADARVQLGLAVSVGVARTTILAKLASREAKPDGLVVVEPEAELAFLHPLAVERVWGIGPATARRLHAHGIRTVGDAARLDEAVLMQIAGKAAGRYVHAVASNRSPRPVRARRGRRSFGAQRALRAATSGSLSAGDLDEILAGLVERVTVRMARAKRAGRTVVVRLRHRDMTRIARSRTLARATADPAALLAAARGLLADLQPGIARRGITLLGITVTNVERSDGGEQLELAV